MSPPDEATPEPRRWSWGSGENSSTAEISGTMIDWTDLYYDERLGDFQHNGRSQTVQDFRSYGPMTSGVPPEVVAELAEHLGLVDPSWARPADPEVGRHIELAQKGDTAALLALRATGADLDVPDRQGNTPLWWAIARRQDDTALALIGCGADVRRPLRYGQTMLMVAAGVGGPQVIRALLGGGVDPRAVQDLTGGTALTKAIERGRPQEVIQLLIDAGSDVDHRCPDGRTPLSMAQRRGRPEVIRALLDAGASSP